MPITIDFFFPILYFVYKIFLTFIYFWDRDRQSVNRGGSEREGDTESKAGSRLWAVSAEPDTGLELTDRKIMTWAEVGRLTDWAAQAPLSSTFVTRGSVGVISWTWMEGAGVIGRVTYLVNLQGI